MFVRLRFLQVKDRFSPVCAIQYTNWVTPRKKINRASKSPNDV